ncbi:MAG: L,D-transpeptidase family protein [Gammaproteobacteria bacterium]|jgi:murein L,D-transpeptidase YafK|nr:L,D-transpeptidase family protein [Gammaproteobacteria bacterium]
MSSLLRLLAVAIFALLMPGMVQAGNFPVADRVIIEKEARLLHLVQDDEIFRTFKIALGISPVGDKLREGDFKTPEGKYLLDGRNPNSDFFLSIHISYPDPVDWRQASEAGYENPGSAIMIHGQPNSPTYSETYYRTQDWTNGCIAVSNSDMIDIWLMTGENTPIEIKP